MPSKRHRPALLAVRAPPRCPSFASSDPCAAPPALPSSSAQASGLRFTVELRTSMYRLARLISSRLSAESRYLRAPIKPTRCLNKSTAHLFNSYSFNARARYKGKPARGLPVKMLS
eukprot:scaffold2036_cov256-Pinguiococcus_pyrenoidosus.AAC.6